VSAALGKAAEAWVGDGGAGIALAITTGVRQRGQSAYKNAPV